MNRKTLLTIFIFIALIIIGYYLIKFGTEQLNKRPSAPYPLAQVKITDAVKTDEAFDKTTPTTKTNISTDFTIVQPAPTSLPMYEYNPQRSLSEDSVNNIIKSLGLDLIQTRQSTVLGKLTIASKDTKNLVAYHDKGELIYTDSSVQSESPGKFPPNLNIALYKTDAEKFLKSLGLENTSFTYLKMSYIRGDGDHAEFTDDSRAANIIQLAYEARVEGLPIINKTSTLTPNAITVGLKADGTVVRFQYTSLGKVGAAFGNYNLIAEDEIKKNIQENKAKLINGTYPIGIELASINIRTAEVKYLSVENYLVPVYILTADVRTTDNRSGEGFLLLDAIKK